MFQLKYPHLFEPIVLGKQYFQNRLFCSPTGPQNLLDGKYPTAEAVAYYTRKAMGGAATACVGECIVDSRRGRGGPCHIPLDDPDSEFYLTKLCHSISRYGAVPVAELQHAGMFANSSRSSGNQIYAPVEMEIKGGVVHADEHDILPEMPEEVILETIEAYANAAAWAKHCGFGMVLIHGGHGWLMSQFLSPYINTRSDMWGGSFENRMRFPLAVVQRIREKCGAGFPIEFRMSGDECNPSGYDFEEGKRIAVALDGKVDMIHVSTGHHEVRDAFTRTHPSMFDPDGVNAHYAAKIKQLVRTPVATVGAHNDPELMEEIIASGQADVVEVARGLIADPDMPRKARCGRDDDIRQCLRCFTCFSHEITNRHIICAINPEIGNETECLEIQPAKVKKKVLVAGGGAGGMQAAIDCAKAGHQVILCEKKDILGGALRCETNVPFKAKMHRYLDQQARFCAEAGVDIRLNTPVTPELALEIGPDVIIAALGAEPAKPPIPGIDSANVLCYEEGYYHPEKCGEKVVVLGGGNVGVELSIYLAMLGKKLTLVEMLPQLNDAGNVLNQIALDQQLEKYNVNVHLSTTAREINENGVLLKLPDGSEKLLDCDTVIYATGQRPLWDAAKALAPCAPEFYQLGDCVTQKNVFQATQTAAHVARNIGRF